MSVLSSARFSRQGAVCPTLHHYYFPRSVVAVLWSNSLTCLLLRAGSPNEGRLRGGLRVTSFLRSSVLRFRALATTSDQSHQTFQPDCCADRRRRRRVGEECR